jgi:hypothetical protein
MRRLVLLPLLLISNGATAFNIGSFKLGMSNAQAKQAGSFSCVPANGDGFECIGEIVDEGLKAPTRYTLSVNSSGVIKRIVATQVSDRTEENRAALARALKLPGCSPNLVEHDNQLGFTCYRNNREKLSLEWAQSGSGRRWSPISRYWKITLEYSNDQAKFEARKAEEQRNIRRGQQARKLSS